MAYTYILNAICSLLNMVYAFNFISKCCILLKQSKYGALSCSKHPVLPLVLWVWRGKGVGGWGERALALSWSPFTTKH